MCRAFPSILYRLVIGLVSEDDKWCAGEMSGLGIHFAVLCMVLSIPAVQSAESGYLERISTLYRRAELRAKRAREIFNGMGSLALVEALQIIVICVRLVTLTDRIQKRIQGIRKKNLEIMSIFFSPSNDFILISWESLISYFLIVFPVQYMRGCSVFSKRWRTANGSVLFDTRFEKQWEWFEIRQQILAGF